MQRARPADPIDQAVGGRLRYFRLQAGLSQQQLAEKLDLTYQQVQKYERGFNRISASKLVRAAEVLGLRPSALLGEDASDDGATPAAMIAKLSNPGAAKLLDAYLLIERADHRRALLDLARTLGRKGADS